MTTGLQITTPARTDRAKGAGGRTPVLPKTASRFSSRTTCWPWAGSRITCARSATEKSAISTSTGTSIPPTFAWRTASLCAFGRSPDSPGAYTFALEEIYARAAQGVAEGATEFHIVGGLHPDLPFDYYLDLIRGLKQRFPQVHLKAFTMVEVHYYARLSKLSIRDTLDQNERSGRRVRCPAAARKFFIRACAASFATTKSAAACGCRSRARRMKLACARMPPCFSATWKPSRSASTIWCSLREAQDQTHGFVTFIPLEFHPANTALAARAQAHRHSTI